MNFFAALPFFHKITYKRQWQLFCYLRNGEAIANATFTDLKTAGWDDAITEEFLKWRETLNIASIQKSLFAEQINCVCIDEPEYPRLLREINDPPLCLFVRGTLPSPDRTCIAVVGTRQCTAYGKLVTKTLATDLAKQNIVIVSGLALGIDGVAHEAALSVDAQTVAVLGSGVDTRTITPRSHGNLAEKIIKNNGAIISEYPPGFAPTQYSFPARNRIVAGLTKGTLVTEAPEQSGALITARAALDYNREVFAVPHPITSFVGAGTNSLIARGAKLVTKAEDILETLDLPFSLNSRTKTTILHSAIEQQLLDILARETHHVDVIIQKTGLPSSSVTSSLLMLELRGEIKNMGGMNYVATRAT